MQRRLAAIMAQKPGPYLNFLGFVHFTRRRYGEAVEAFHTNVQRRGPLDAPAMCWWAASYVGLNQIEDAQEMARRVLSESPDFTVASWSPAQMYENAADTEHLKRALLDAGLPE